MTIMNRLILLFVFLPIFLSAQKQEPFIGKLVYSVEIADTAMKELIPPGRMTVYTNDTITRIENETFNLGKQVVIKHLQFNKSYLLIETPEVNFAIQISDTTGNSTPSKYSYKKKCFKRKIAGLKANRLEVNHPDMKEPREFLYLKNYSPKYINTFEDFPGLPVNYFIITMDGVYEYKLVSFELMKPDHDLFGIPSDYKRVTFEEFMEFIIQEQTIEEP